MERRDGRNRGTLGGMASEKQTGRGHVGQVAGLVSTLGRVVKQRIGEFAAEADEELRTKISEAREDLDEELKDAAGTDEKT